MILQSAAFGCMLSQLVLSHASVQPSALQCQPKTLLGFNRLQVAKKHYRRSFGNTRESMTIIEILNIKSRK